MLNAKERLNTKKYSNNWSKWSQRNADCERKIKYKVIFE